MRVAARKQEPNKTSIGVPVLDLSGAMREVSALLLTEKAWVPPDFLVVAQTRVHDQLAAHGADWVG